MDIHGLGWDLADGGDERIKFTVTRCNTAQTGDNRAALLNEEVSNLVVGVLQSKPSLDGIGDELVFNPPLSDQVRSLEYLVDSLAPPIVFVVCFVLSCEPALLKSAPNPLPLIIIHLQVLLNERDGPPTLLPVDGFTEVVLAMEQHDDGGSETFLFCPTSHKPMFVE